MGKRQESRERIEARIIELGRQQLVSQGAAALSLRAIARDLGIKTWWQPCDARSALAVLTDESVSAL